MKPKEFERAPLKLSRATIAARKGAEALLLPYWKGKKPAFDGFTVPKEVQTALKEGTFEGDNGQNLAIFLAAGKEKRIILVGLGDKSKISDEELRKTYGSAARAAAALKIKTVNALLPEGGLRGSVEGMLLGDYRFEGYKTEKPKCLEEVTLLGISEEQFAEAEKYRSIVKGVYLAQDLVNSNADDVTPSYLCSVARALDKQFKSIRTEILGKKDLEEEKFGLLLAVNRGSKHDPALIICKYKGDPKSKENPVIIGKGITYDTGGLDLKSSMLTMKCDMGGAAACLGLLLAAGSSKLKANFTVVIPTTENGIDAVSYKPGDVYKSYDGKTVEIGNTDAEGRLILADALAYARKNLKPTEMIDFATLTGAMVIALGHEVTGMMANDDRLAKDLEKAGEATYERVCRFPLIEELKKSLESDIADLVNVSGKDAGSIKAALFLREFVGDVPWAHFDIAGTAYLPAAKSYLPKHASGVGVRLMMEYLS